MDLRQGKLLSTTVMHLGNPFNLSFPFIYLEWTVRVVRTSRTESPAVAQRILLYRRLSVPHFTIIVLGAPTHHETGTVTSQDPEGTLDKTRTIRRPLNT